MCIRDSIYARAIDDLHQAILTGLQVERILMPEQRAAHDLVNELALGTKAESMRIDRDRFVIRFAAPEYFHGMRYQELTGQNLFGMTLIGGSRPRRTTNILGLDAPDLLPLYPPVKTDVNAAELRVEPGDVLTCAGSTADAHTLLSHLR